MCGDSPAFGIHRGASACGVHLILTLYHTATLTGAPLAPSVCSFTTDAREHFFPYHVLDF